VEYVVNERQHAQFDFPLDTVLSQQTWFVGLLEGVMRTVSPGRGQSGFRVRHIESELSETAHNLLDAVLSARSLPVSREEPEPG